jgi:hypothetical protein
LIAHDLAIWMRRPFAADCHPEAEDLLPTHVAAGSAGNEVGRRVLSDRLMGKTVPADQFG